MAVLLLGVALSLYKVHFPPGPVADEATYVMMTQSLWHDFDLRYTYADLQRAYRIWDHGPHGLILFTTDGGETMYYGKPFVYSLVGLPFYLLFGTQGFVVLNMVLFLLMMGAAWLVLRPSQGWTGIYVSGFFLASAAFCYVFWMQPEVFNMTCVFLPLALWWYLRRRRDWKHHDLWLLVGAGVLLAASFVSKEPSVLLGFPIVAELALERRWRGLAALAGGAVLCLLVLIGGQLELTGQWSPYRNVQRRSFENEYPLEARTDLWELYKGTTFGSWTGLAVETNWRVLVRNCWYFLVGRHTGLLPYFPFALFALALYLFGPKTRASSLLLLAIIGYCGFTLLVRSHNYHGGAGFIGNRYFASIYPTLLLLPGRVRIRRTLVLPLAAAGIWTLPVVAVPVQQVAPEFGLQVHTRMPTFQVLPLELTLLPDRKIPGYWVRRWGEGLWIVPKDNFFAGERHPNGVWVRGASRSEVTIVTPARVPVFRFKVYSLSPENVLTVAGGGEEIVVRFDSEAKRLGTPIELRLSPVARNLDGFFRQSPHEYYYRFTLTTTDGLVPMRRDPKSIDPRYLGSFLDFTDGGY